MKEYYSVPTFIRHPVTSKTSSAVLRETLLNTEKPNSAFPRIHDSITRSSVLEIKKLAADRVPKFLP